MNEKRMRISRTAALSGAIFAWLTISGGGSRRHGSRDDRECPCADKCGTRKC